MITLKDTAEFIGLSTGSVLAIIVVNEIFNDLKAELILTSGTDWIHAEKSDHYNGNAFDIRIRHLTNIQIEKLIDLLHEKLNKDYFILKHKTHIHISFRPSGLKREKIAIKMLESKGYKIIKD